MVDKVCVKYVCSIGVCVTNLVLKNITHLKLTVS